MTGITIYCVSGCTTGNVYLATTGELLQYRGTMPYTEELAAGLYDYRVEIPGYPDQSGTITIQDGYQTMLGFQAEEKGGDAGLLLLGLVGVFALGMMITGKSKSK